MRILLLVISTFSFLAFLSGCAHNAEAPSQLPEAQQQQQAGTQSVEVKAPEAGSGVYNNPSNPGGTSAAHMISPLTQ